MSAKLKNGSYRYVTYANPNKLDEIDIIKYMEYKSDVVGIKESVLIKKALRLLMENDSDPEFKKIVLDGKSNDSFQNEVQPESTPPEISEPKSEIKAKDFLESSGFFK